MIRDFIVNGKRIDLLKNSNQAHKECYKDIINKRLFGIEEVKKSIELALDLKKWNTSNM